MKPASLREPGFSRSSCSFSVKSVSEKDVHQSAFHLGPGAGPAQGPVSDTTDEHVHMYERTLAIASCLHEAGGTMAHMASLSVLQSPCTNNQAGYAGFCSPFWKNLRSMPCSSDWFSPPRPVSSEGWPVLLWGTQSQRLLNRWL